MGIASKANWSDRTGQMTRRRRRAARRIHAVALPSAFAAAVIAAVLQTDPVAAQTSENECVQRAEAVKTEVVRRFGGDDPNYGFFRRADQASELCRSGQIGKALGIIAALRADIRGYRSQQFDG